jgi:Predicted metal-dependent hydrolase
MQSKTIYLNEVGNILLRKSKRAKYLNLTIKPVTGVIITVPERVPFEQGELLAHNKIDWIKTHLEKFKESGNNFIIFDEETKYNTRKHSLEIRKHESAKTTVEFIGNIFRIKYPASKDIKSNAIQKQIRLAIEFVYRKEALQHLPQRINELSQKVNIPFNRVFIKNIKSRWGSCSVRNNINLSIHLMQLPDSLIDYVILHELAHVVVKNHSAKFWLLLDKLTGNAKRLDKELKKYKINF